VGGRGARSGALIGRRAGIAVHHEAAGDGSRRTVGHLSLLSPVGRDAALSLCQVAGGRSRTSGKALVGSGMIRR